MKKDKLKKVIAATGVITVSFTPVLEAFAYENNIENKFFMQLNNKNEIEFLSNSDRYNNIIEEAERLKQVKIEEEKRLEEERIRQEEERKRLEEEAKRIAEINRIDSVRCELDNVLIPSNLNVDELIAIFDYYEYSHALKEIAWIFIEAEQTYGINAFILSAIASWESDYGRAWRAVNTNNYLGWGVTSPSAEGINASSPYENIMGAAKFLRAEYLTEGGLYYNGLSTWGISRHYCNPSEEWRIGVNSIAKNYEWIFKHLYL